MKNALYVKFLFGYVILGILSIFVISLMGSALIEQDLTRQTGDYLYKEAVNIASNHADYYYSQQASPRTPTLICAHCLNTRAHGSGCWTRKAVFSSIQQQL